MNQPIRQSVTASGTTTIDDPNGLLVFYESYKTMAAGYDHSIQIRDDEIQRLREALDAVVEPLEIRDTTRADVWVTVMLAGGVIRTDAIALIEADRLLVEYDKRFTDPEEGYVDIQFDGAPGPYGCKFMDVVNENGKGVSLGEWLEVSPGDWVLRITPESLHKCL